MKIKELNEMLMYNTFENFQKELKIEILNYILSKFNYVKFAKEKYYIYLLKIYMYIFGYIGVAKLVNKIIKKTTFEDFLAFKELYTKYTSFSKYVSFEDEYKSINPSPLIIFESFLKEKDLSKNFVEIISFSNYSNGVPLHGAKFVNSILKKYMFKSLFN